MNADPVQNYDVLLTGRYFCDLVFTCLPEFPRLGHEVYSREFHLVPGGVFTPAVTLTRLGLRTVWPCEFGSDPFSQFVKGESLKAGVDDTFFTQSDQPSLRITVAFSFGGERAFLSYIDPLPEIPFADIIRRSRPKWVYITHLMMGEEQKNIVQAAREVGARVYMDCQAHHTSLDDLATQDAIARVDVFSPNREEALKLTGETSVQAALVKLSELVSTVIIKDGAEGCLCSSESKVVREPGIDVKVVDTTGAGDNFNCGFIYGQIKGSSLEESLRIGNICGGLSVSVVGGSGFTIDSEAIEKNTEMFRGE
jgi:sugar/nucleoside kinase (ribokinase family)